MPPASIVDATLPARTAVAIFTALAIPGMILAYHVATEIAGIRASVATVAAKASADTASVAASLDAARQVGSRERQQLASENATQAAALAGLQAGAALTATDRATTSAQMTAIVAAITAMQDDIKTLLRQRRADIPPIERDAAARVARRDGGTVMRAGRGVAGSVSPSGG